jgi:hypothetical protein
MNPYAPPTARVSDPPHDDRLSPWVTKLLALMFAVLSLSWALLYQRDPVGFAAAGLCGLASFGLWLARPWSRWVVYLLSTLLCSYFAWYVAALSYDGWPSASDRVVLIPGALHALFGVAAAVYVERVFRK